MKSLIVLFILVGCDQAASKGNLEFEQRKPLTVETDVTFKDVKDNLFATNKCLNCHGFLNDEAQTQNLIEPGKPELSPLYIAIENGSMPIGGPMVSQEDLNYLKQYIEQMTSSDQPDDTDNNDDEQGDDMMKVTLEQIEQKIVKQYGCASCHGRYNDVASALATEVVPGDPSRSKFYNVLDSGFMPLGGPQISEEDLDLVEKYIRELDS